MTLRHSLSRERNEGAKAVKMNYHSVSENNRKKGASKEKRGRKKTVGKERWRLEERFA